MIRGKKINMELTEIDKIYHISDVHIRNLKRHKEYKIVFDRLIESIKLTLTKNSVIFLGGDIVHAKTDMTPELVQSVQEFFKQFADIAPTILITGNHDCNLNNKTRLDALTPIVNALNHKNLYYLKDSGVYQMADKTFVVMSVFDKPKDFIRSVDVKGSYKIALHHGAVNSAVTDIGFTLVNENVPVELFDGYDLVLLGDIHKPAQYLNREKTIAYPGSTIQQNHSEALDHGYLVWDTKTKQSEFIVIENDFCYYTVDIDNGSYEPLPEKLKRKQIRLRVRVQNTDTADLKKSIAKIKSEFQIEEISIQRINDFKSNKNRVQKINIGDVRDVEYQNELISKYLENKFALDDDILDGVRYVNRTVNSSLSHTELSRNVSWIPKRFEFSNMFSYGKDNVVDFTNMKGLYGLFAPNASGKSTFLDSITYCIFDKCSRASKASNVLNNRATSFSCKFQFELNGKDYFIERIATKGRHDHVRVAVNFYSVDDLGNQESLNGKERSETNSNIRSVLGTYEDFVLTTLSIQNNNSGFIDMDQRNRKDLLSQFLDINVFETLYDIANTDIKEVATLLKEYKKQDLETKLAEAISSISEHSKLYSELQKQKNQVESDIEKYNSKILELTSKVIPIDSSITDLDKLVNLKNSINSKIEVTNRKIDDIAIKIKDTEAVITSQTIQLGTYNIEDLKDKIKTLESLRSEEKTMLLRIERLKSDVSHKLEKMKKLEDLQYDENCQFCMNNIFVKDAIETKESINFDKIKGDELIRHLSSIRSQIEAFKGSQLELNEHNDLLQLNSTTNLNLSKLTQQLQTETELVNKSESLIVETDAKIEQYHKTKDSIALNNEISMEINSLKLELDFEKTQLRSIDQEILDTHSALSVAIRTKEQAEASIEKLKELIQQYKFYEYYLQAVSRDGVPYDLISTAVPYIEQEINNILSQIVDFNLMLDMDGKNINCHIVYDEENFWPIELTSGMEKFISSLAIRTALVNVSNLPRPNFLAIDEGFGVLDSDNMNSMFNLFDYMKTQFSFIMVISHIDSMRDIVDKLIEIVKSKGQSKIQFI